METRFNPRARRQLTAAFDGLASSLPVSFTPAGFSTELPHPPPVGSRLEGHLTLDGLVFPFQAEVAWSQPGDPRMSFRGRMTVRFIEVPDELFEALRA
jgi:hypothetical protein